jgi:hypothetical protein
MSISRIGGPPGFARLGGAGFGCSARASTKNLGSKYRRWNYSGVIMATSATVRKGQPFKSRVDDRYAVA